MINKTFKFKRFDIQQNKSAMKVNTDGILLGSWTDLKGKSKVLDIGTGTGIIALMLAQRSESLLIDALEIDALSCEEAFENVASSQFASQIQVIHDAIQNYAIKAHEKYDLVISNPPFFSGGTLSFNENKSRVRHTVKLSHTDLLYSVQKILVPEGAFDVVLPLVEGTRFIEIAKQYHFYPQNITEVKSLENKPIERLLIRLTFQENIPIIRDSIVLKNSEKANDFTPEFSEWVKDFYLFL